MKKTFDARIIGTIGAVLGLGMMVCGLCRGEAGIVLQKAVRICLECIGIG